MKRNVSTPRKMYHQEVDALLVRKQSHPLAQLCVPRCTSILAFKVTTRPRTTLSISGPSDSRVFAQKTF